MKQEQTILLGHFNSFLRAFYVHTEAKQALGCCKHSSSSSVLNALRWEVWNRMLFTRKCPVLIGIQHNIIVCELYSDSLVARYRIITLDFCAIMYNHFSYISTPQLWCKSLHCDAKGTASWMNYWNMQHVLTYIFSISRSSGGSSG